jgi:hypothetical protein
VPYRVTSIYRRIYFTVLPSAAFLLIVYMICSDPNGSQ